MEAPNNVLQLPRQSSNRFASPTSTALECFATPLNSGRAPEHNR